LHTPYKIFLSLFLFILRAPPRSSLFPYTTLFRSLSGGACRPADRVPARRRRGGCPEPDAGGAHILRAAGGRGAGRVHERRIRARSEEHTSELQSRGHLVCRLLLEKKNHRLVTSGD